MISVIELQLEKLKYFLDLPTKETSSKDGTANGLSFISSSEKSDINIIYQLLFSHLSFYECTYNLGVNLNQSKSKEVVDVDGYLEVSILKAKQGFEMMKELNLSVECKGGGEKKKLIYICVSFFIN